MATPNFEFVPTDENLNNDTTFPSDICDSTPAAKALYLQMTQKLCTQDCIDAVMHSFSTSSAISKFIANPSKAGLYLLATYQLATPNPNIPDTDQPSEVLAFLENAASVLIGNVTNFTPSDEDSAFLWNRVVEEVPSAPLSIAILGLFCTAFDKSQLDSTLKWMTPKDDRYKHLKKHPDEYQHAKEVEFNTRINAIAEIFNKCDTAFISQSQVPDEAFMSNLSSKLSALPSVTTDSATPLYGRTLNVQPGFFTDVGGSRTIRRRRVGARTRPISDDKPVETSAPQVTPPNGTVLDAKNNVPTKTTPGEQSNGELFTAGAANIIPPGNDTEAQDFVEPPAEPTSSEPNDAEDDMEHDEDFNFEKWLHTPLNDEDNAKIEELQASLQGVEALARKAIESSDRTAQAVAALQQTISGIQSINSGTSLTPEQIQALGRLRGTVQSVERASATVNQALANAQGIVDAAKDTATQTQEAFQSQANTILQKIEDYLAQIQGIAAETRTSMQTAQEAREQAAEEIARIGEQSSSLSESQIAQLLELIGHPDPNPNPGPSGVDGTRAHQEGDSDGNLTPPPIAPRVNIPQKVLAEIYAHAASREQIIAAIHAVEDDIAGSTANAEFLTRFAPGVTQSVIKDILINRTPSGQYITRTGARGGEGIAHTNLTGGHTFISGSRTRPLGSVEVPAGFTQDNSSVLWNEPIITSMGFPFINFGAPEIQMILKGKDEKQVKQSYAKLKKQMKRVGLSSPIKVLKDFKNAKGVTCAINRITVDANDLTEVGNAQVMASVYPRVSTDLQTSIGTVPLTRDFIVEVYNVLSPVKGAKIYMDTLGMSEEEYANMINRNGRPPLYIFVPKERTGFRKGASSFISRLFTSNSKPTLVEAQIGSHHGGFIMPFRTTQLLFTEV